VEAGHDLDPSLLSINSPNRLVISPIRALMTLNGYCLDDPQQDGRLYIWFTSVSVEISSDPDIWRMLLLTQQQQQQQQSVDTNTNVVEPDGKLTYRLDPESGNGRYVSVVYLDETLRIVQGNQGTVYVFARVPHFPDE
jgi:hypothetical protein